MNLRRLIVPAAVALVLGVASSASAHTPGHNANCAGITVAGVDYQGGTVDLRIGTAHAHHVFTGSTFAYTLGNPDKTITEPWSIDITSNASDGSAHYTGSIAPCATAPGTTTTTTTSLPPPPSTAPNTTTSEPASTTVPSSSQPPPTSLPGSTTTPTASSSTTPATQPPTFETGTPPTLPSPASTTTSSPLLAVAPPTPATGLPATGTRVHDLLFGAAMVTLAGIGALIARRPRKARR